MSSTKTLLHDTERAIKDAERELKRLYKVRELLGGETDVSKPKRTHAVHDWKETVDDIKEAIADLDQTKPFTVKQVHSRAKRMRLGGKWSEATTRKTLTHLVNEKVITYAAPLGRTIRFRLPEGTELPPSGRGKPESKPVKRKEMFTADEKASKVYDAMRELDANASSEGVTVSQVASHMNWDIARVRSGIETLMDPSYNRAYQSGETPGGNKQGRPAKVYKLRSVVIHAGGAGLQADRNRATQ